MVKMPNDGHAAGNCHYLLSGQPDACPFHTAGQLRDFAMPETERPLGTGAEPESTASVAVAALQRLAIPTTVETGLRAAKKKIASLQLKRNPQVKLHVSQDERSTPL
jgi:hypothetical protein